MKKKIISLVSSLALIIVISPVVACGQCALLYPSSCPPSSPSSVNQPPVLNSIGNKMVNEGQPLTFSVLATDPNGGSLVYSAYNLPTGASFTSATRTFSWAPSYGNAGTYENVCFKVSDGELSDSEEITITVTDNQAPVLGFVGNKIVSEGQLLTFVISATDPDGDPLVYSASDLPMGASFTAATRTFCWTPGYGQAGNYTGNYTKDYTGVHFEVVDGELTDHEDITITLVNVTLNTPVDLDSDTINLKTPRQWLTVYIELAEYQPELVDLFSVRLNLNEAQVPAVTDPKYGFVTDPNAYTTDKDGDGIPERLVKFDWSLVKPLLEPGYCTLLVNGRFLDWPGLPDFEGTTDTVLIIS